MVFAVPDGFGASTAIPKGGKAPTTGKPPSSGKAPTTGKPPSSGSGPKGASGPPGVSGEGTGETGSGGVGGGMEIPKGAPKGNGFRRATPAEIKDFLKSLTDAGETPKMPNFGKIPQPPLTPPEPPQFVNNPFSNLANSTVPVLEEFAPAAGAAGGTVLAPVVLGLGLVYGFPSAGNSGENSALQREQQKQKLKDYFLKYPPEPAQELQKPKYEFPKGQGDGVLYKVQGRVSKTYPNGNGDSVIVTTFAYGPIKSLKVEKIPDTTPGYENYQVAAIIANCKGTANYPQEQREYPIGAVFRLDYSDIGTISAGSWTITKADNQPDNTSPEIIIPSIISTSGITEASPQTPPQIQNRTTSPPQIQNLAPPSPQAPIIPDFDIPVTNVPTFAPALSPSTPTTPTIPNTSTGTSPAVTTSATPTILYGPWSDPGTIKINFPSTAGPAALPFTPNTTDRSPVPLEKPSITPKLTPSIEPTDTEIIKRNLGQIVRQTSPSALATAAETGVCRSFDEGGCNEPIKINAKEVPDIKNKQQDLSDKLNKVADRLSDILWVTITVPTVTCELSTETNEYKPTRGITTVSVQSTPTGSEATQVQASFEEIAKAAESACYARNNEVILGVPEHWAVQPGADRPQLVITFRSKNKTNGKFTKSKWSMSIPHPNFRAQQLSTLTIDPQERGEWMAEATLKDNSKIRVHLATEMMAENYLDKLVKNYVSREMWTQSTPKEFIKTGVRPGIEKGTIYPAKVEFYKQGVKGELTPNKKHYFKP